MKHIVGIRVKDMRPILMDQHATGVEMIVSIAGDVGAAVNNQHLPATHASQLLGGDRSGEAGPDNQIVEGQKASIAAMPGVSIGSGRGHGSRFRDEATISWFIAFQV